MAGQAVRPSSSANEVALSRPVNATQASTTRSRGVAMSASTKRIIHPSSHAGASPAITPHVTPTRSTTATDSAAMPSETCVPKSIREKTSRALASVPNQCVVDGASSRSATRSPDMAGSNGAIHWAVSAVSTKSASTHAGTHSGTNAGKLPVRREALMLPSGSRDSPGPQPRRQSRCRRTRQSSRRVRAQSPMDSRGCRLR